MPLQRFEPATFSGGAVASHSNTLSADDVSHRSSPLFGRLSEIFPQHHGPYRSLCSPNHLSSPLRSSVCFFNPLPKLPPSNRIYPAIAVWVVAMMLNSVVNVWAEYRAARTWPRDPTTGTIKDPVVLPDLGFQFLPYFPNDVFGFSLADVSMNVVMLIAVIRAFVGSKPGHPFIVLKRVLLLSSVAYLGRAVSVPITMLPSPDMRCVPRLVDGSMFWSVMLMPFGLSHTCADVFYSGHSIPITLSMLFWIDYAPSRREKVCGSLLSVVALLVILCTHFHYTLDVLYGVGLTVIIWRLYHWGLTVPAVVLNSKFYMFWEADAFMEDTDDADTSESSTTPLSMPTQLAGDSHHDSLLIDIEKGHKSVCLQLVSPAEVVSWKLCEEPRITWARVACDESDHREQRNRHHHGYKAI